MFFLKKFLCENTFIPQGMWNLLLVTVILLRPIYHQQFKGPIYALNFSYICHCIKLMTVRVSRVLPQPRMSCSGWPWGGTECPGDFAVTPHVSAHSVWGRRSFCEIIVLPLRQDIHLPIYPRAGANPFCRVLSRMENCPTLPLSSISILHFCFLSLTHILSLAPHLFPSAVSQCPELLQNLLWD